MNSFFAKKAATFPGNYESSRISIAFSISYWGRSITPDKKIFLDGQFAERISEYVEKPLTATALAVTSGSEQMVLVSADLAVIGGNLMDLIRERLATNELGLDPTKVILSAIHTHTGPVYTRKNYVEKSLGIRLNSRALLESILPEGRKYIESAHVHDNPEIANAQEILDLLVERISACVLEAWKNRTPGAYVNAFGRAAVGMCRRATYSDGSALMWGNTNTAVFEALEGGNDSGIELLYVYNETGKLTGIIANLACPAQCVQHRHFVSPDFWGEVKMLLRKHFGEDIFLLPQRSAAGDQCPVDLVRWVEPESDLNDPNCTRSNPPKRKADPSMFDLAGMRKAGRRIAREIIDVYEEGLGNPVSDVPFEHHVHMMQLPLRRVTLSDVAAARKGIQDYFNDHPGDVDFSTAATLQIHLGILRRAELQELLDILPAEVHIIRLGSIAIATNPFELFLDYGNQIKARSLAEQTFLIQLCCGHEGYLPTEKAEKGGHYSAFVASGSVGHAGGNQLVRQTLQGINRMFRASM